VYSALERIFSVKTGGKIQEDFIACISSKNGTLFKEISKLDSPCEATKLKKIKGYFKNKEGDAGEALKSVFCDVRIGMYRI